MSLGFGKLGAAAVAVVVCAFGGHALASNIEDEASPGGPHAANFLVEAPSADARYAADWVVRNADHLGRPFAIVDKKAARLYVFAADGRLSGASSVLIGLAPGDDSIADIARRTPASLTPTERTTPAGRYASEPGHNQKGEDIVWFDYDASLAIHRLRPSPPSERRRERLESALPEVKRISFGCVVVPVAFYDDVVSPSLGRQRGVVYVLPETRPVREMFGSTQVSLGAR